MKYAILCNAAGIPLCGSDGVIPLDGRWNRASCIRAAQEYRERFREHFSHKVEFWTHVGFTNNLRDGQIQNRVEL